jgi:hypothetical protein
MVNEVIDVGLAEEDGEFEMSANFYFDLIARKMFYSHLRLQYVSHDRSRIGPIPADCHSGRSSRRTGAALEKNKQELQTSISLEAPEGADL